MATGRGGVDQSQVAALDYSNILDPLESTRASSMEDDSSSILPGSNIDEARGAGASYFANIASESGFGGDLPAGATVNPYPQYTPDWYTGELENASNQNPYLEAAFFALMGGGLNTLTSGLDAAGLGASLGETAGDFGAAGAAGGGADLALGGAGLSDAGFLGGAAGAGADLSGSLAGAASGGAGLAEGSSAPLFAGGASGGAIAEESPLFGGGATSEIAGTAGAAGGGATLSDGSSAIETPGAGSGLDGGSGTPTPTANSLSLGDSTNSLFSPSSPASLDAGAANGANTFGGIGGGGGDVAGADAGGATLSDGSAAIDTPTDSPWWQKALKATGIYNPNNPLGIGKNAVSGLGMIYNGIQQKNAKNSLQKQIQDASGPLAAESKSLIAQGNSGAVPPAISAQYATQRDNAIAAIKQRYANMGRDPNNDSQAAAEILAANNAYGTALATYSNQLLTEGMQAASIVQDAGIEAAKAGASEDAEFQKSLMNFLASTGLNAAGIK